MFKNFIVATDLSPASHAVVSCLSGLKDYGAENCLLLQCLSFADAASSAFSYDAEKLDELLGIQKELLEQQGFRVEARNVVGSPKHEINRIANIENYDLIVVGAQGKSLTEEKLLGGVAYGVINKSEKPVLVIPVKKEPGYESSCAPVERCKFSDHLLFATDFSEMADNAFAALDQLVAHGVKKVTMVHVQDKTKLDPHLKERLEEFNERDRQRIENLKKALLEKGSFEIDTIICYGIPHEEIARLVLERNAQMVVMGTQGRGFMGEIFLGSVSHNVARLSEAPVLLIPIKK